MSSHEAGNKPVTGAGYCKQDQLLHSSSHVYGRFFCLIVQDHRGEKRSTPTIGGPGAPPKTPASLGDLRPSQISRRGSRVPRPPVRSKRMARTLREHEAQLARNMISNHTFRQFKHSQGCNLYQKHTLTFRERKHVRGCRHD